MARTLLSVLLVASASCASVPRWIPPEHDAVNGRCSAELSCGHDDQECLREAAEASQVCGLDRIAQTMQAMPGRLVFDELARLALARNHRCGVTGYDARDQLEERLLEKLPAVVADMDRVAGEGRVDLAARRAEFVLEVFRTFHGRVPHEAAAFVDRARAFHEREAKRLATSFPAAAGYHACGEYGQRCPRGGAVSVLTPELRTLGDAEADALGVWFTKLGPPECHAVIERLPVSSDGPPPFALTSTHVHLDLTGCAALPDETETTQFSCGQQVANATVVTERYVIEGTLHIGADSFPYRQVFEQKRADQPLTGCFNVPAPRFESAEDGALFALADHGAAAIFAPLEPRADRLLLVALRAQREGDRDRADAAYAVLLSGRLGGEHQAHAEEYFEGRFGAATSRLPSYAEGIEGSAMTTSEIGVVASRRSMMPSCY